MLRTQQVHEVAAKAQFRALAQRIDMPLQKLRLETWHELGRQLPDSAIARRELTPIVFLEELEFGGSILRSRC